MISDDAARTSGAPDRRVTALRKARMPGKKKDMTKEDMTKEDMTKENMASRNDGRSSAMTTHLPGRWIGWTVAAVGLGLAVNSAVAGSFTRGCAARDMQILMLIEERENTNAVSQEQLSDAIFTMLHARMICYEGHVLDALAIYDGIAVSIAPKSLLSDRRR
jgi:hypothetical protein